LAPLLTVYVYEYCVLALALALVLVLVHVLALKNDQLRVRGSRDRRTLRWRRTNRTGPCSVVGQKTRESACVHGQENEQPASEQNKARDCRAKSGLTIWVPDLLDTLRGL
jgi:hypothetical protein